MREGARVGRKIGAIAGAILFLVFGLVPGFYFGSFGALAALNHLFGHSVEPTVLVRMVIVLGALLGLFCMASVSIVLGAVTGTMLGIVADAFSAKPAGEAVREVK